MKPSKNSVASTTHRHAVVLATASRRRPSEPILLATLATLMALAVLLLSPATADAKSREFTFEGSSLSIANLVGSIEIVSGSGSGFEIQATVHGKDASKVSVDFDQKHGTNSRFVVGFPVEQYSKYVYPEYGGRTRLNTNYNDKSSLLSKLLGMLTSDYIEVSGRGSGLELWVDLVVTVPVGARLLEVENGVGDISVHRVAADLNLRSRSGRLTGNELRGDSVFDLGSGAVRLSDIQGELLVDTGSGSVSIDRFEGPALNVDTGSGRVSLSQVRTRTLHVDTGSGGVDAEGVSADSAIIDTGSGEVRLALTEMGEGDFTIDTGSGGITLLLPDYASARVNAETGSGGIDVALSAVRLLHRERDEMLFEIGKGKARVDLDTGSGAIRIAALDR